MTPPQSSQTTTPRAASHERAPRRRRDPGPVVPIVFAAAAILTGAFAYLAVRHHDQQDGPSNIRASGIPADVPTSLANLMQLSPVLPRYAPNFTLLDQNDQTVSLDSFRGRTVVLEFMDSHCVDICPFVSQEFVDAYHDLGKAALRVAFLAVNVNQYFAGVGDVATFSREHGLDSIPSWHFFTGSVGELKAIWQSYGIEVQAPSPDAEIIHTSIVYFIDPDGRERLLASPTDDHAARGAAYLPARQLASWGRGIALVAHSLSN